MKKSFLSLLLILTFITKAQKNSEPEFAYRPYFVNLDGSLKGFERVDMIIESKPNAMGRNWQTFYIVYEAKSFFRISKAAIPKCIIKIEPGKDPADLVRLYKGKAKKSKRNFLSSGQPEDLKKSIVKIEFKKISDDLYEILLPDSIELGEYAFVSGDSKVSCFGVD
jgi:hypothetical protein